MIYDILIFNDIYIYIIIYIIYIYIYIYRDMTTIILNPQDLEGFFRVRHMAHFFGCQDQTGGDGGREQPLGVRDAQQMFHLRRRKWVALGSIPQYPLILAHVFVLDG